jgi:cytochrome c oxidase assembly protein subunit 15
MSRDSNFEKNNRQLAIWLFAICALIYCMILLGGATRLTESGLSMVDWKPIMGIVPPIGDEQWQATFEKYQQFPEYQKINKHRGMDLEGFKSIFYFEYGHRVLGRLIGLAFLLPFLYFLIKGKIHRSLTPRFVIMLMLGGLQGLLGWYMVKSGLVNIPSVSQYRLTAHLGAAMAIYIFIFWTALNLLRPQPANTEVPVKLKRKSIFITGTIILMILSGGFVAGTDAGFVFNTFPLMYDHFAPPGMYAMSPFYINWFENVATIQFNHRLIAYLLCLMIPAFWLISKRYALSPGTRLVINLFLVMLVVQVGLGIATLLYVVPVALGVMHQGGALLLLTLALLVNHELREQAFQPGPQAA